MSSFCLAPMVWETCPKNIKALPGFVIDMFSVR